MRVNQRLADQVLQQVGEQQRLFRGFPEEITERAWARVDLVEPELARRLVADEVEARRAGPADMVVGRAGPRAQPGLGLGRQVRVQLARQRQHSLARAARAGRFRAALLVAAGEVFLLEVQQVFGALGLLDGRGAQCAVDPSDRQIVLDHVLDERLKDRGGIVFEDAGQDGGQFVKIAHARHPDAAAQMRRLDDAREREFADLRAQFVAGQHKPFGRPPDLAIGQHRDTGIRQDALGRDLVHQDRRGVGAHAGIGDVGHLQRALQTAILAEQPVEGEQGGVEFDHLWALKQRAACADQPAALTRREVKMNLRQSRPRALAGNITVAAQ